MEKITKSNVVDKAMEAGFRKKQAQRLTDHLLEMISQKAFSGEIVSLNRFGKFLVTEKSARPGRNPTNNKPHTIPARERLNFKPSPLIEVGSNND